MTSIFAYWRVGLVAALLTAAGVWHLADKSKAVDDAVELVRAEYITAALAASEQARSREKQLQTTVQEAKNAAIAREKTLLADAGRSRAQSDGLRNQLAAARSQLSSASRAAVDQYAATSAELLIECGAAYSELARQADGHSSDAVMLIEAWPR